MKSKNFCVFWDTLLGGGALSRLTPDFLNIFVGLHALNEVVFIADLTLLVHNNVTCSEMESPVNHQHVMISQ